MQSFNPILKCTSITSTRCFCQEKSKFNIEIHPNESFGTCLCRCCGNGNTIFAYTFLISYLRSQKHQWHRKGQSFSPFVFFQEMLRQTQVFSYRKSAHFHSTSAYLCDWQMHPWMDYNSLIFKGLALLTGNISKTSLGLFGWEHGGHEFSSSRTSNRNAGVIPENSFSIWYSLNRESFHSWQVKSHFWPWAIIKILDFKMLLDPEQFGILL